MSDRRIGILGMGHKLPSKIRTNDDPIFDWLRDHNPPGHDLFVGFNLRHVLAETETVLDILEPAARMAMDDAGVRPADIDHVIGCVSPNTFIVPADLFHLTGRLGLPAGTTTIPLANDFSNFNIAVLLAEALVRTGCAHTVLVAIGGGWTRAVSYFTAQAISAADGAAAMVIGAETPTLVPRWTVVDSEVIAQESCFGEMALYADPRTGAGTLPSGADPSAHVFSGPFFQITPEGLAHFSTFGGATAPLAALRVIQRQGLALEQVTVTGHQASRALFDAWKKHLSPAPFFDTLENLGNMTVANIPVNLCVMDEIVATPFVVALALAPDMHAHALLLRKEGPQL